MNTKADLLKQIDDAASQYGGPAPSTKSKREAVAIKTGQMVMEGPRSGLSGRDLAVLNEDKFKHANTLLSTGSKQENASRRDQDLRSIKSEYDYGSKKKFVDVLGNVRGKMKDTSGNGLKGLEALRTHEGNKNMETTSQRSKMSIASSRLRHINRTIDHGAQYSIPEEDEMNMQRMLKLVDKDGKTIELSAEQLLLLEQLSQQQNLADLTERQKELLKSINFDDLQNLDPEYINEILDQSGMQIPYKSKTIDRTNKRMYSFNYHQNSDDYKNLGTLHKEKRTVDYFPQDHKQDFSTKPQILGTGDVVNQDYDFSQSGVAYSQKKPKNLTGNDLRANRGDADDFNNRMIMDKMSVDSSVMNKNNFPKTTNQDFHCDEVFQKAMAFGLKMDKSNFKR